MQIKAARIVAPRTFEMVEVEAPEARHDGSLVVQTEVSAICGSDLPKFCRALQRSKYPLDAGLPAHECIGTVAQSRSRRFREGDRVLALPDGMRGLAERFVAGDANAVSLQGHARDPALVLAQPLGTVICALRRLGSVLDRDVVVLGQGPTGLVFTRMLANLGARRIMVIEPVAHRRELGARLHATHLIDPRTQPPVEAVAAATGGQMADVAVECVGHQTETVNLAIDLVKRKGTVLAFGVPDEHVYPVAYSRLFRRNLTLIGSVGPDPARDFGLAVDLLSQGRVDLTPLISHRLHFTAAQRAFELAVGKGDGAVKILLQYC